MNEQRMMDAAETDEPLREAAPARLARILIVDDSPLIRRVLRDALAPDEYTVTEAVDGEVALGAFQKERPDLVLLDITMPKIDGIAVCRQMKLLTIEHPVPVLMITGRDDEKSVERAFTVGADEYITKPIHPIVLRHRVRRLLETEKQRRLLESAAMTDYLTGVLNRRAFTERLQTEVQRARRQKISLSLIMTDIDFFKRVNDTYGHLSGDEVLKAFAKCLLDAVRVYDFAGRFGGEEFVICLPGANSEQALMVAERLRGAVEKFSIPLTGDQGHVSITASFGVALLDNERDTAEELLERADTAMYRAKQTGRNRVCEVNNK
ncbi:MAG TPA: diguanylate cyclase [Patescibacteria group bacterium]|nr:diguanylate cyclase [Patescibacteria group bacterium]